MSFDQEAHACDIHEAWGKGAHEMYWIICVLILLCLLLLFTYTRMAASKLKKFHLEYKNELQKFEKHASRELFDWDEVAKRRTNEFGGDIP